MLKIIKGMFFLVFGYALCIGAYLFVAEAAEGQLVNGVWRPAVKVAVVKKADAKAPVVKAAVAKAPAVKAAVEKAPAVKAAVAKAPVVKAAVAKSPAVEKAIIKSPVVKAAVAKAIAVKIPVVKVQLVKTGFYTLQDMVLDVSKSNSNALYEYMQYEIADHSSEFEKGIFEPEFYTTVSSKRVNVPNSAEEFVTRGFQQNYTENSQNYELGFRGLLATGAQWEVGFVESGRSSSLINQYRTYGKEYQGAMKAKIRQPLLRGFGSDATKAKINTSESDKKIAQSRYEQRMMEVVGMTIRSYWELFGALKLQTSWEKSLQNSQKVYDDLQKKSRYGKVAKTELMEAEAGISLRRGELSSASTKVIEVQNNILTLLNTASTKEARNKLALLENPVIEKLSIPSFSMTFNSALKHWPNLKIAKERVQRQAVQVAAAKNKNRLKLDFVGDYNTASLNTTLSAAQRQALRSKYSNWAIGLELSIPLLGGQQGEESLAIARVGAQQADLELTALRMSVMNSLRSKLDQLESSQKQMFEYRKGLVLKRKLFDIEMSKFHSGKSDVHAVLTLEEGFINYQRKFLDSLVKWKLAQVSLDVADGSLLSQYGVSLVRGDR